MTQKRKLPSNKKPSEKWIKDREERKKDAPKNAENIRNAANRVRVKRTINRLGPQAQKFVRSSSGTGKKPPPLPKSKEQSGKDVVAAWDKGTAEIRKSMEKAHASSAKRFEQAKSYQTAVGKKFGHGINHDESLQRAQTHIDRLRSLRDDHTLDEKTRKHAMGINASELIKHSYHAHDSLNAHNTELNTHLHKRWHQLKSYGFGQTQDRKAGFDHRDQYNHVVDQHARESAGHRATIVRNIAHAISSHPFMTFDSARQHHDELQNYGYDTSPIRHAIKNREGWGSKASKVWPEKKSKTPAKKKKGILGRLFRTESEEFKYFNEESGAGEIGTDELLQKYKSDTPGEEPNPNIGIIKRVVSEKLRQMKRKKPRRGGPASKGVSGDPVPTSLKSPQKRLSPEQLRAIALKKAESSERRAGIK